MTNKFYIINEDGIRVEARILSKFRLANNNDYIVYTLDEINEEKLLLMKNGIILNQFLKL